jgi:hypothetical protein
MRKKSLRTADKKRLKSYQHAKLKTSAGATRRRKARKAKA